MSQRFQAPQKHRVHGWYVCTLSAGTTLYVHSDGKLRDSTLRGSDEDNDYTGYYESKQEAMDALVNHIRNHL